MSALEVEGKFVKNSRRFLLGQVDEGTGGGSGDRWWPDDRDRIGMEVWVASRCWSAFGHQITSAPPITGLRPDIKSAWPSLTSTRSFLAISNH